MQSQHPSAASRFSVQLPLPAAGSQPRRVLHRTLRAAALSVLSLALVGAVVGCDKKEDAGGSSQATGDSKTEQEKIARLEALLKENGVDPNSVPSAAPSDNAAGAKPAEPTGATPVPPTAPGAQAAQPAAQGVEMLSTGKAPLSKLRYVFESGRSRNFSLDISSESKQTINGQAGESPPPVSISLLGKVKTLTFDDGSAKRENTFLKLTPNVAGLPPEILAQVQAQYQQLSGLQMIETVSERGVVTGLQVDQRAIHPQVLALMQQLQDGMTNAYMSLPEEAVGEGARWISRTESGAGGLVLIQENEVLLKSLKGSKAEFELTFRQKAKGSKLNDPSLPPGVEVELNMVDGKGTGAMTVDFKELVMSTSISLNTKSEVTIKEPGNPTALKQGSDTTVRIKITYTK